MACEQRERYRSGNEAFPYLEKKNKILVMASARCYDHIGLAEQIMTLLIIVRDTTGRRFALRLFQDLLLEITAKVKAHFEHTFFKNRTADEISRIGGLNWRGDRRIFRMPIECKSEWKGLGEMVSSNCPISNQS